MESRPFSGGHRSPNHPLTCHPFIFIMGSVASLLVAFTVSLSALATTVKPTPASTGASAIQSTAASTVTSKGSSKTGSTEIVSSVVGRVGDYFITSREVVAGQMIEMELYPSKTQSLVTKVSDPNFVNQVTATILEKVVAVEAENFSVANVSDGDLNEALKKIKTAYAKNPQWAHLALVSIETEELVSRKLRSKNFLKYKSEAASLTVTNFEVKEYFEKNRYKFGNLPFENFKENIRQFLAQKQTEERLREWFEVLRKKYQVRNFLSESR